MPAILILFIIIINRQANCTCKFANRNGWNFFSSFAKMCMRNKIGIAAPMPSFWNKTYSVM